MRRTHIFLCAVVLVLGYCLDALAVMNKQEVISKFVLGNQAYKQGQYEAAIKEYESITEGGRESGQIYYNLGNAYFKNDELGLAITNYERAKQLIPRDSDLIFNYEYAQSKIKNFISSDDRGFFQKAIDRHVNFYTIDEMVIIVTLLVVLLGGLFLLSRFLKWSKAARWLSKAVIIVLILIYAAGLSIKSRVLKNKAIIIRPTQANFEPSLEATSHFELAEGMSVKVVRYKDGWVKIKRTDGRLGWIEKKTVQEI